LRPTCCGATGSIPAGGREGFQEWAAKWLGTLGSRKPKTRESYESIVNRHLLPRFGPVPIGAIDYPLVLAFVADMQREGVAAGTIRNIRDVLRLVLGLAVKSGALKANPVTDVEVARTTRTAMIFLEPHQIMALAAEVMAPPLRYRREDRRREGYPSTAFWFGSPRLRVCGRANSSLSRRPIST